MRRHGASSATVSRPAGLARGSATLAAAWLIAFAIAMLTGAAAVMIMLAVGLVAGVASVADGWWTLRHARLHAISTSELSEAGAELVWQVESTSRRPLYAELRVDHELVASGWLPNGTASLLGRAPRRGVHGRVEVRCSSAGTLGNVWWRRSTTVAIGPLVVAPQMSAVGAPFVRRQGSAADHHVASPRPGRDEIDGVRTWRDGDELTAIHWPATLRSGEFIVRQRHTDSDQRWLVEARSGTGEPDLEAARVRSTLERALATGDAVAVQVDDGEPIAIADRDSALRWCASFECTEGVDHPSTAPWWRRQLTFSSPETSKELSPRARWAVAAASAAPPIMLLQPLGYGPAEIAAVLGAIAVGAALTMRGPDHRRRVRQGVGLLAGAAVAIALVDPSAIGSVVASLRFLLPQLLVTLVVVQGFECADRRSARVALACAAMLTAYAAGIRVDDRLAVWLGIALIGLAVGAAAITRADRSFRYRATARSLATRTAGALVALAAVLAVLAVVPIPAGPAQLTLPSWLDDYRPTPGNGGLVAPDGSPLLGGANVTNRSGNGAGGYPGFSPTMDTSLRGDLGDQVVLRVRAQYPDYWRGQTFSRFDGRSWFVDDDIGPLSEGTDHVILPTIGDVVTDTTDQFIQTFYAEVDLPNIVFAATRAQRVLLDAPLRTRPDGALRAEAVLPAGSAYTVVSQRSAATAAALQAEGDVARPRAAQQFLEIPPSTSDRTRALARQLAAGTTSTYDTVMAIQAWLATNVRYNLNAPVPPDGVDAVDHFLFESKEGFCEQIATATAIMLRSLDIPARIATGYVPSERDEIAGVWVSKASDAHAWVEVQFPNYGWVAFDPTASVPLSGEAQLSSIGGDLARALGRVISEHITLVLGVMFTAAAVLGVYWLVVRWWRRRRRGKWGVLQDRFVAAAVAHGATTHAPNAELATVFEQQAARELAAALDASAFSAEWADDDELYQHALTTIRQLERSR